MTRWSGLIAVILTMATVGSGVATMLGFAPWLFLVAFGAAGTYVLAPRLGWGRGAWSIALVALFAESWILVVDPYVGVRLDIATIAVLGVTVVIALALLWKGNRNASLAVPRALEALVMLLPAVASAALFYGLSLVRGMPLGWAMQGDAQFNTVLSRQVGLANGEILNGGQVLSLAQGLMAIVHLPGRSAVAPDGLLIHDIASQANLWMLMILLSSVLAGAIAERVLRGTPRMLRLFGILAGALLPLAWHMTGYALASGFYNVSIAFFTIELAVYFWLTIPGSPLWRSTALLAITVIMLGAWTPMAVIPGALAAWSAWQGLRRNPPRLSLVVWMLAAFQLIAFVVLFVLPGFLAKSAVLSVAGSIIPLSNHLYFAIIVAALFVAVLIGTGRRGAGGPGQAVSPARHFGLGLALIAGAAALGTGFLIFQNRHLPDYWTYYPIKFAWISMELLVLLVFIGSLFVVSTLRGQRLLAVTATVSMTVILISMLQLNPPPQGGVTSAFPLVGIARSESPADATLSLLTTVSGKKVFFYRYSTLEQDTFMNQWQFQITAKDEFTPIRNYAYSAVSSYADACAAASAWGGGVQVITARETTAGWLNAKCGSLLTAVVREPLG